MLHQSGPIEVQRCCDHSDQFIFQSSMADLVLLFYSYIYLYFYLFQIPQKGLKVAGEPWAPSTKTTQTSSSPSSCRSRSPGESRAWMEEQSWSTVWRGDRRGGRGQQGTWLTLPCTPSTRGLLQEPEAPHSLPPSWILLDPRTGQIPPCSHPY